ncbi:MAG: hypothetical protein AB8B74_03150 [Crocinitomicaceae bacterium]
MTDFRHYETPENLLLFKTSIASKQDLKTIRKTFSTHHSIIDWWVDIDDCDKVMRVEVANKLKNEDIISILKQSEFACEILE